MVNTAQPTTAAAKATADTPSSSNSSSSASSLPSTTTTTTSTSTGNAAADTAASNGAGSPAMSAEERDRLTKLGVVLVNVGAAPEEKVFGIKGSAAMQTYHSRGMTDLLVINRRIDDAAAHPFQWYNPWTWWSSGPQVSPIVRVPVAAGGGSPSSTTLPGSRAVSDSTGTAATAVSATQTAEADLPPPPVVEQTVKPKKKKGLPTVDLRPLTDDEVAALTPAVQEDRSKMLKSEEKIHKALQNIEDTRYRYLVPSRDLHCEAEVIAVVRCYTERNAAAAARAQGGGGATAAASDSKTNASLERSGVVRADLLACGPDVQRLKKCTDAMAMAYSHDGHIA